MRSVVYDASVLIAADRNDRHVWAEHRVRLEAGVVPLVPAPVIAQVSRSPAQAQMRRFIRGCEVVAFSEGDAHRAGALLGTSRTRDVVDASVASLAIQRKADVVSDDLSDIVRLLSSARSKLRVLPVGM
jgi:predicted nucleic acid-binding protein